MKKLMRKLMLLAVAVFAAQTLAAEVQTISVDQAVEMARENNLGLKMSSVELRTLKRRSGAAWNSFLPTINASIGIGRNRPLFGETSRSVDIPFQGTVDVDIDPTTSLQAGLRMSLPINIGLGYEIRQTILDYDAGAINYEKAVRELETGIRKHFWQIKLIESRVDLLIQNLETLEDRYEQTKVNYENGTVPELSLLSSRVSLENARPTLNQTISDLDNAKSLFKFMLGIEQDREIELEGSLEVEMYQLDPDLLIDRFIAQRLDLRDINQQIKNLKNKKNVLSLYNLTPTLVFGLNWGTKVDDKPFESDSWDPFFDNLSLTVNLDLPLDGFIPYSKKSVQIREIKDGIDSLELARQQIHEKAEIDIHNMIRKLESSQATIEAYDYNLQLAQRNYELNNLAYEVGSVELLQVKAAQDELFQAEFALLNEKFNYLSTLLDIEFALNSSVEAMGAEQTEQAE